VIRDLDVALLLLEDALLEAFEGPLFDESKRMDDGADNDVQGIVGLALIRGRKVHFVRANVMLLV
jgi:hypothetical protein